MADKIDTPRLYLKALSSVQLEMCLHNLTGLEADLGLPVAKDIIDPDATRAINLKLVKMAQVDVRLHDWFTYWLIVVKAVPAGAGLIGFKGYLDADGKTEVGYGIGAAYRNQGYTTEALKALSQWAFLNPACRLLTADTVSNPASNRVLQKSGWKLVKQNGGNFDWELRRANPIPE